MANPLDTIALVSLLIVGALEWLTLWAHAADTRQERARRKREGVSLLPWWYWLAWGAVPGAWLLWRCV